jgi:hypothetical protein
LFSQSGTFGATFAITDTAPNATGPDTTGLDSDRSRRPRRWTVRSSREDMSSGYVGSLFVGAAAPRLLALSRGQRGRSSGTNRPSDET